MLAVAGVVLMSMLLVAGGVVMWRIADREGLLLPVIVGFGIRLALVLITHIVSVANGHGGFLYSDDHGYASAGQQLADQWAHLKPGNLLQPVGILPHGGPLYYHLLAGVFLLTSDSVIAMKLVDVLAGTATVLLAGILAGRVLGPMKARPATWAVALAPTIVWWTIPMLREALATMFAIASLLAATYLPRWRAAAATAALLCAVALTRSTLFAAVALGVVTWGVFIAAKQTSTVSRVKRAVVLAALLAVASGMGVFLATGSSVDLSRISSIAGNSIESSRSLSRDHGSPPAATKSPPPAATKSPPPAATKSPPPAATKSPPPAATKSPPPAATKSPPPAATKSPPPAATKSPPPTDQSAEDFDSPFINGIADGGPLTYGSAAVRFFVAPRAWAFATVPFDWYQPLYPGMWLWYLLIPVALLGLWRLRRSAGLALLALPIAVTAGLYTLALNSGVRQRSGVEPLLAILIVAGWQSWMTALRMGSIVLFGLAPVVALDLHEPLAGVAVAVAAIMTFGLGRRLGRQDPTTQTPPSGLGDSQANPRVERV